MPVSLKEMITSLDCKLDLIEKSVRSQSKSQSQSKGKKRTNIKVKASEKMRFEVKGSFTMKLQPT